MILETVLVALISSGVVSMIFQYTLGKRIEVNFNLLNQ